MARTKAQLTNLSHALEHNVLLHGMCFYLETTELLTDPRHPCGKVCFSNGEPVPTTTQVKYLASMTARQKPFVVAFRHRAAVPIGAAHYPA